MSDDRHSSGKVDSFFVETRLHCCRCFICKHNMSDKMSGERGKYCEYKKTEITMDGRCAKMEERKHE